MLLLLLAHVALMDKNEKTRGEFIDILVFFPSHSIRNFSFLVNKTEKAMAPYSSTLAWKIPRMEEPGGLLSMGSHRVRHD